MSDEMPQSLVAFRVTRLEEDHKAHRAEFHTYRGEQKLAMQVLKEEVIAELRRQGEAFDTAISRDRTGDGKLFDRVMLVVVACISIAGVIFHR